MFVIRLPAKGFLACCSDLCGGAIKHNLTFLWCRLDLPSLSSDVLHIALMVNGMVVVQPLMVMSAAAAAEMQQLWARMALAVAQRDMQPAKATCVRESEVAADPLPVPAAELSGAMATVKLHHLHTAWRMHFSPLLVDLAYFMAGSHGPAVQPATHLLQYLLVNGMWHTVEFVAACAAEQMCVQAPQGACHGVVADECHAVDQHTPAGLTMVAGSSSPSAFQSAVAQQVAVQQHTGHDNRGSSSSNPATQDHYENDAALARALSDADAVGETDMAVNAGGMAGPSSSSATARQMASWLLKGFTEPGLEANYLQYKQDTNAALDVFIVLYHGAGALVAAANYPAAANSQHASSQAVGKLAFVCGHLLAPIILIMLARLRPGWRDVGLLGVNVSLALVQITIYLQLWVWPPMITKLILEPGILNDILLFASWGIIRPCAHQVGCSCGCSHAMMVCPA